MTPDQAERELCTLLQMAYSGERAAAYAYIGHGRSLRGAMRAEDRERVRLILIDEIRHRRRLRRMLRSLDSGPDHRRERKMGRIGRTIGAACLVSGWYFPMYGAGRLERDNIEEYEIAARLAHRAGRLELVDELLEFAEVEWDHEDFFRTRAQTHWLWRVTPSWTPPAPRDEIRLRFKDFVAGNEPDPHLRWTPLR